MVVLLALMAVYPQPAAMALGTISQEELRADLKQAYGLLESRHPNLNAHTSRAEFDALYQRLLEEAKQENTALDAYGVLTELVGAVCDEHTMVDMNKRVISSWPQGWPWFDYPLMVDGGKLYMQPSGHRIREEVLSVGGVKGFEIASDLAARFPSDGCLDDGTLFVNGFLPISGNVIAGMIGEKGPYVVKSKARSATKARTRFLHGIDRAKFSKDRRNAQRLLSNNVKDGLRSLGFQRLNLGPELNRAGLDYWYSEDHDMAYLSLAGFRSQDEASEGIERVMRDVIKKDPGALIIDLAGNSGGATNTAQLLMAFLLPRAHRLHESAHVKYISKSKPLNFEYFDEEAEKLQDYSTRFFGKRKPKGGVRSAPITKRSFGKPDYKGQLYILLDPSSRSNSIRVATNLKRLRDATIVGSVTATNTVTSCPRANGAFTLEHTEFRLLVPEMCYRSPGNRFNDEATLVPDIPVSPLYTPLEDLSSWTIKAAVDDYREVVTN